MLIKPKDYMNNGNPQIITKSDFKYCFQHMLSPEISPPLNVHPERNLSHLIKKPNLISILRCFSAHLTVVKLNKKRSNRKRNKAQVDKLEALFVRGNLKASSDLSKY